MDNFFIIILVSFFLIYLAVSIYIKIMYFIRLNGIFDLFEDYLEKETKYISRETELLEWDMWQIRLDNDKQTSDTE